jgi:hypothetical protein
MNVLKHSLLKRIRKEWWMPFLSLNQCQIPSLKVHFDINLCFNIININLILKNVPSIYPFGLLSIYNVSYYLSINYLTIYLYTILLSIYILSYYLSINYLTIYLSNILWYIYLSTILLSIYQLSYYLSINFLTIFLSTFLLSIHQPSNFLSIYLFFYLIIYLDI